MADDASGPVTWGWEEYFSDLAHFLRDLGRQAGIASVSYAEYAIERLEMCEGVCTHLVGASVSVVDDDERDVVEQFRHTFLMLRSLLNSLRIQWLEYFTAVESTSATSYHAPHSLPTSPTRQTQFCDTIRATGISTFTFFHLG